MSAVDVVTETVIDRPRAGVAAYVSDADNATAWYRNITSVEWETERPARVGSRIAFVARFLGRTIAYTYEVRELVPGERLVMSTSQNAEGARISGDMAGAKVAGAVFDDGRIDPSLFAADGVASAHVVGATFSIGSSAALHGVDFGVMDLSRVSFMGFGSTLSDMRESDFRHATLSRTSFYGVDLTGARFVGQPLPAMGNAKVMFLTGLCPDGRKVTPGKAGFASCRLSPP